MRAIGAIAAGLIALTVIPLSIFVDRSGQAESYRVRDGVLDLSGWKAERDERIELDGEWAFYWNRLLMPGQADRERADIPAPDAFIQVPGQWNGRTVEGQPLPAHGFATYRMVLKNVPAAGSYAIKKTNIRFASAVYANGRLLFEDGRVTEDAEAYRAGNTPQIGFFSSEGGDIEIIVQVANFDYANSGIPASLSFGEQSAMQAVQQAGKSFEFGTFAVLAALALIFFISYGGSALYRNRDDSLLLLGLICLFYAVYNGLVGERVITMFVHGVPFETLFKVKDISSMVCLIVLALYFYRLRASFLSRAFATGFIAVLGGYAVMVALLPIPVYGKIEPLVILVYVSMILWLLLRTAVRYVKSGAGERLESFLLYAAVLCITLYCIDMIMFSFNLKDNVRVGQAYIVLFSILVLLLAVLRFFAAYRTVHAMKDQLLRLDRIKDDFLSSTSHELKTPLNAIVNITDSLLKGAEGPLSDEQARNLAIVVGSGRRLTYMVDELLDYSKMKHGDVPLHRTGIDLKTYVDSVVRIHRFLLGGKPLRIVNGIAGDFPALYADGNRLVQILHNLIGNAIKFTEQGEVSIAAEVDRDMAVIRVSDTGSGIAPDMLERIFLPFEQADAIHAGGTGLGLSITRKLVELHGGTIRASSAPGEGAKFVFTMPLAGAAESNVRDQQRREAAEQPVAAAAEPAIGAYPIVARGEKDALILVVDDDAANLQTMVNLLKLGGYSYTVANSGRSALDLLRQLSDVHLAIVDIRMPDMTGYEVLRSIRERFAPSELPVLMLTASNKADELKLALESGANDFVAKPFESEELMARVSSLTRLKTSAQEARDAEIAFLRSQINPHFLHNALNAIAELCVDMPDKAEQLTLQLSRYLRSCIQFKQLDSLTGLRNELELVEAYAVIEQARFGERLEIRYEVDADPHMRIPPLILQPLVENAIRHGVMSRARGGRVTVSVKRLDEGEVRFAVEDDGVGMSARKLEEVLQPDASKNGVGLWNIGRRLKLLYDRILRIDSAEGEGTRVTFELPVRSPDG